MAMQLFTNAIAEAAPMRLVEIADQPEGVFVPESDSSVNVQDLPVRSLVGLRACYYVMDIQEYVDIGVDAKSVADAFKREGVAGLPEVVRPGGEVPEGTKVALIATDDAQGKVRVLLTYSFPGATPLNIARCLLRGAEATPLATAAGVWNIKKGFQLLLGRVVGQHVRWVRVEEKQRRVRQESASANGWQPTPGEVKAGLAFIKENLPPDGENLEQIEFCMINRYNPSPIFGWPQNEIDKCVRRVNSLRMEADIDYFYPLLVSSLKDDFRYYILQLMLSKARTNGLLVAGPRGIGKTPLVKIWGLLIGRYWVKERDLNRTQCLRRGKKLERFRSKAQDNCEMLMLDDPSLDRIDPEELLDFFELSEAGSGSGRYSDTKYNFNATRALLTNTLNYDAEPESGEPFATADFWKMVESMFGRIDNEALMAIFKRCTTLIAGNRFVVLRLPSREVEAPIHVYTHNDIAQDFLSPVHKEYLNMMVNGVKNKFPGYDEQAAFETEWATSYINGDEIPVAGPLFANPFGMQVGQVRVPSPGVDSIPPLTPSEDEQPCVGDASVDLPAEPQPELKRDIATDTEIAGAILAAQEAEREGVISLSSPEYQDTVVKQEMLSDEAIARAMQAAEAMHARKLQIQVDSDSDDGDDGAPQHVGTVVESTASQAPQPGMCITIPGMGFGRMLIVTPDIIRQLSAEELIDELESPDCSIRFAFKCTVPVEHASTALVSAHTPSRRDAVARVLGREQTTVDEPPAKKRSTRGDHGP